LQCSDAVVWATGRLAPAVPKEHKNSSRNKLKTVEIIVDISAVAVAFFGMTNCSPQWRHLAANGSQLCQSEEGSSRCQNVNNNV